jgi:hypothetical protein
MYARAVDEAEVQLRELRQAERGELAVAAFALGASIIATEVIPSLAAPLFVGGLVVGALGARAMWRHWDLLERLSGERDAYVISEVFAFATRETTMERRHSFAALIRGSVSEARLRADARVLSMSEDLEALAAELEDERLELEPAAAVACMRLLSDVLGSPLLNRALPVQDLRSRICQIRSGFTPRELPDVGVPGAVGPMTRAV